MKATFWANALAVGIFVGTTCGRPLINKRAFVTEVVFVTEEVAGVAVYVDEDGTPYSTSTIAQVSSIPSVAVSATSRAPQSTSKIASAPPIPSPPAVPAPPAAASPALPVPSSAPPSSQVAKHTASVAAEPAKSTQVMERPTTTPPPPPPPPATVNLPSPPPATSSRASTLEDSSKILGLGITYDPYTGAKGSSGCKSADQIAKEFDRMSDYAAVRIYGMDCNLVPLAVQNVVKHGKKLMAGAYLSYQSNSEDLSKVIKTLKDAVDQHAGGNWDVITLFSVENERVNEGDMPASAVVDAIQRARDQLRRLGYNGPVGAVETVPAMVNNPAICKAADVAMVNSHAFFDSNTQASDAGTFVKGQVDQVRKACDNKRVVVTESGWPHQGNSNGKAVASPANQEAALKSLRDNFNGDLYLFNAFDSPWKSDTASTFNAEPYWGIL
ncbi:manno protein MP65 [Phaeosphaeria sp. MPI-PUGE-AT-0046c]|nr:manno protein MP65 [Phaeosphaeria sp. MPI-PUGE-AT-0046c]